MGAPPNLPTNHVNDVGEFVNANTINALALAANKAGTNHIWLDSHDLDVSGAADSTSTINGALTTLPATGGVVHLPAGVLKVVGTLSFGNGSASGISTRNGMMLEGAALPGMGITSGITGTPNAATRLVSTGFQIMVSVNGPVQGWGLQNLQLDGANVGNVGTFLQSAQGGVCRNVMFTNFAGTAVYSNPLRATGVLAGQKTNTMHNDWRNIIIAIPNIGSGAGGIQFLGNFADISSNTCFEYWNHTQIMVPLSVASGTSIGIHFVGCDNIYFYGLSFNRALTVSGPGSWISILYNYNGESSAWPADVSIDHVDIGTNVDNQIQNLGVPGSPVANRIVAISQSNGRPVNPNLANLAWGYSNASP